MKCNMLSSDHGLGPPYCERRVGHEAERMRGALSGLLDISYDQRWPTELSLPIDQLWATRSVHFRSLPFDAMQNPMATLDNWDSQKVSPVTMKWQILYTGKPHHDVISRQWDSTWTAQIHGISNLLTSIHLNSIKFMLPYVTSIIPNSFLEPPVAAVRHFDVTESNCRQQWLKSGGRCRCDERVLPLEAISEP